MTDWADAILNQPTGELTAPNSSSAIANAPGAITIKEDSRRLPKMLHQGVSSLPTDPDAKIRYLAKSIFPDLSEKDALSRMGVNDGRAFYAADDGNYYYAEPSFSPLSAPGRTFAELPNIVASNAGPAFPVVGGIVGGAVSEPLGGIPGAAGGGFVGDTVRQLLSSVFVGETKTPEQRLSQSAGAAGEQALAQTIGLVAAKGLNSAISTNPLRVGGYDAAQLTPGRLTQIEDAGNLARGMGVSVTPGEAGNVRSLLNNQRQLFRQPESATPLSDFYANRNNVQIPNAYTSVLNDVYPTSLPSLAPALGARDLGDAAQATIDAAKKLRSENAGPIYKEAFKANQQVESPFIDKVLETPAGRAALDYARTRMQNKMLLLSKPDPELTAALAEVIALGKVSPDATTGVGVGRGFKLQTLDYLKQGLDDEYKALQRRVIAGTARDGELADLGALKKAFTKELDNLDVTAQAGPNSLKPEGGLYQQARKTFAGDSPEVSELQNGIVGLAAKDRASGYQRIPSIMFSPNNADPLSISSARSAYEKAGQIDKWNAGLRSYLQGVFNAAQKTGGNSGTSFQIWKAISGDTAQLANLRAAMTPAQFSALQDFMKVAEMVKRAPAEGSPTATDLGSRASFAGPIARTLGTVTRGVNVLTIPQSVSDWMINLSAGKNAAQLVDTIASPGAIASLRRLKMMSPGSQKFVTELGNLASSVVGNSAFSQSPPNQPPGYLNPVPSGGQPPLPN